MWEVLGSSSAARKIPLVTTQPVRAAAATVADRLAAVLQGRLTMAQDPRPPAGVPSDPRGIGDASDPRGTEAPAPVVAVVLGAAGSGRSGVVRALVEMAKRRGQPVRIVEDAHRLDEPALAAIEANLGGEVVVLSWIEPLPAATGPAPGEVFGSSTQPTERGGYPGGSRAEILGRLAQRAARQQLVVNLAALTEDELARGAATLLGAPPDQALIDWLMEHTGGQPWLVHATLSALVDSGTVTRGRFTGPAPAPDAAVLAPVLDRIRAELGALPVSCRPALAAMVADHHPHTLAEIAIAAAGSWSILVAAGLVGAPPIAPLVLAAAEAALTPAERAAGHQAAASLLARRGASAVTRAEHGWQGRAHNEEAAQTFLEAGFEVLAQHPRQAAEWFDRAACTVAGSAPLALTARGAQAEALALAGEVAAAVELADFVLGRQETEPHATAAVALASARRSRWVDVARWSARVTGHLGVADAWWWWQNQAALLVAGRVNEVEANLVGVAFDTPVTPVVAQLREAVLIMRASLGGERGDLLAARRAARSLIGAQGLLRPPSVAALGPAELLAATALALGEPEGARLALRVGAAGAGGSDGGRLAPRRAALVRWAVLRCGDTVRPRAMAVDGAGFGSDDSSLHRPSNSSAGLGEDGDDVEAVALAVEAALARRRGDVAGTATVARKLAGLLSGLQIDLLNVDAASELLVVARRFAPPAVAEEFDDAIETFLASIGNAPAWSARWHWARLEAAIATGRPIALEAPALALEAIATVLPGISVLADAASVWLQVLTATPDPARIDTAVRDLRLAGHVWEAAQLAGQAAIRVEDATLAKSLLGQARSLRGAGGGGQPGSVAANPAGLGREDGGAVTPGGLSEREVEVARLVLNGLTHKAIGATLYISPKTVEHHVAHIRQKLGATNRAEFLAALREDLAALSDSP